MIQCIFYHHTQDPKIKERQKIKKPLTKWTSLTPTLSIQSIALLLIGGKFLWRGLVSDRYFALKAHELSSSDLVVASSLLSNVFSYFQFYALSFAFIIHSLCQLERIWCGSLPV